MIKKDHEERIKQRRERIEKMLSVKRSKILETEEKKKLDGVLKSDREKDAMIKSLFEKVELLEKDISQMKLDFKRYRTRNAK
jgi:hypothetical protein